MADCIDWQIIAALRTLLSSCTTANGYNTNVATCVLIGSEFGMTGYPALVICPNETDPDQDYLIRDDILPFVIVYSDGENESAGVSYIERYKNVAADLIKCIKTDPTLGGLAQNVSIKNTGYTTISEDSFADDVCYLYVEVERTINGNDPYQLS